MKADEALRRLREGNARFVANLGRPHTVRPLELKAEQLPVAIILGCADSRVPAELVFDQGLGDLFVVRVAGNIVAPSLVGSVEFAASQFGTRLVVVLGHTRCGAVLATLEEIRRPASEQSPNIRSIVELIRPSVEGLGPREAVRANISASVGQLERRSSVLRGLMSEEGLRIVGAEYSLETGAVEFL